MRGMRTIAQGGAMVGPQGGRFRITAGNQKRYFGRKEAPHLLQHALEGSHLQPKTASHQAHYETLELAVKKHYAGASKGEHMRLAAHHSAKFDKETDAAKRSALAKLWMIHSSLAGGEA